MRKIIHILNKGQSKAAHMEQATGKMSDQFKSASLAPGKVKRSQFNTKFTSISSQFNFLKFLNMKVKNVVLGSIPAIIHRNSLSTLCVPMPCSSHGKTGHKITPHVLSEHFNYINYKI